MYASILYLIFKIYYDKLSKSRRGAEYEPLSVDVNLSNT